MTPTLRKTFPHIACLQDQMTPLSAGAYLMRLLLAFSCMVRQASRSMANQSSQARPCCGRASPSKAFKIQNCCQQLNGWKPGFNPMFQSPILCTRHISNSKFASPTILPRPQETLRLPKRRRSCLSGGPQVKECGLTLRSTGRYTACRRPGLHFILALPAPICSAPVSSNVNLQLDMPSFAFGGEERERIEVSVHAYERAPVGDYYDDNWVRASVVVSVGSFSGNYDAAFLTSDFASFREALRELHQSLTGVASFSTLEEQLSLQLAGDGLGHVLLKGIALDAPGTGNRLEFELALDHSYLLSALEGLDEIVSSFPVRAG